MKNKYPIYIYAAMWREIVKLYKLIKRRVGK